jgi:hypothetical protein
MCSTADIVRYGVVVELVGFALALFGIYKNWTFSGGAGAVEVATVKAQAAWSLLARTLDSIERAVRPQEPETEAHPGTGGVTATAYDASASSPMTLTAEAAGTVNIPDPLTRLEWQVQGLTRRVESVEREREALGEALVVAFGEWDADRAKREEGDQEAEKHLRWFARSGVRVGALGVLLFSLGAVLTGLPAGTEHLLCG